MRKLLKMALEKVNELALPPCEMAVTNGSQAIEPMRRLMLYWKNAR
jgi:hypothetical protein